MAEPKNEVAKAAQNAVAKPNSLQHFTQVFGKYTEHIDQAAPKKGIGAKRVVAICSQYYASHPELHSCDVGSMIGAVLVASAMDLNVMLREVYFIPYSGKIQLQISYFGWIKLAQKSGMLKSIDARCVYEGDAFDPDFENKRANHKMGPNYGDPFKVTHAYCVVEMTNGARQIEFLTKNMIERLRMKSPMQKSGVKGPWATDYDKMAIAKVIKQALRMVPMQDEWRSFTFADESITTIETARAAVEEYDYQYEPTAQEGSAVLVPDEIDPLQAQLAKEAAAQGELDLKGGGK